MPKRFQRRLQNYISKLKNTTPSIQFPSATSLSLSTTRILSGCKYPKTPSFAFDRTQSSTAFSDENAATLSDIDRFLSENFKSLYENHDDDDCSGSGSRGAGDESYGETEKSLVGSPRFMDTPPDMCSSERFFAPMSLSSSLIDEAHAHLSATTSEDSGSSSGTSTTMNESVSVSDDSRVLPLPDDSIAVLTYSPSPYDDFRRSMHEMIEARIHQSSKIDWDFMEELLFCYLNLNEKKSHKFILSAFVDLIMALRQNSGDVPARSGDVQNAERGERKTGMSCKI